MRLIRSYRTVKRLAPLVMPMVTLLSSVELRAQQPVLQAREVARIGEDQRTEFSFGKITGLAVDDAGHLFIADGQDNQVVVFDARGRHLRTIGRKGKGPGEFEYPTSLGVGADGTLWVREMDRVQRFRPERRGGPATQYAQVAGRLSMHDWTSTRTGVVDRSGAFHVPVRYGTRGPAGPRTVQMMHRMDSAGVTADSLMVPEYANEAAMSASYMVSASSGRMLHGLNHVPFAPVPMWTSSPAGTIISGDALSYELRETDAAGRLVRTYSRPHVPVTIDAGERRDSLRALTLRIDSIPVPLSQVQGMPAEVLAKRLPSTYPPFREISVARDGALWVRRWISGAERGTSRFDVFSAEARFLGTVVVPADLAASPAAIISGRWIAGVVNDQDTGLQSVVSFDVSLPSVPASSGTPNAPRTP